MLAVAVDPFLDADSTGTRLADGGLDLVLLPCWRGGDDGKVSLGDGMLTKHVQQCSTDRTLSTADDDAAGFEVKTMHRAEIFAQLLLHDTLQVVQARPTVRLTGYATRLLHRGKIPVLIDEGQTPPRRRCGVAKSDAIVEFETVRGFEAASVNEQCRRCDALLPLRAVEKTKLLCQVYVEPFATVGAVDRFTQGKIVHDERQNLSQQP